MCSTSTSSQIPAESAIEHLRNREITSRKRDRNWHGRVVDDNIRYDRCVKRTIDLSCKLTKTAIYKEHLVAYCEEVDDTYISLFHLPSGIKRWSYPTKCNAGTDHFLGLMITENEVVFHIFQRTAHAWRDPVEILILEGGRKQGEFTCNYDQSLELYSMSNSERAPHSTLACGKNHIYSITDNIIYERDKCGKVTRSIELTRIKLHDHKAVLSEHYYVLTARDPQSQILTFIWNLESNRLVTKQCRLKFNVFIQSLTIHQDILMIGYKVEEMKRGNFQPIRFINTKFFISFIDAKACEEIYLLKVPKSYFRFGSIKAQDNYIVFSVFGRTRAFFHFNLEKLSLRKIECFEAIESKGSSYSDIFLYKQYLIAILRNQTADPFARRIVVDLKSKKFVILQDLWYTTDPMKMNIDSTALFQDGRFIIVNRDHGFSVITEEFSEPLINLWEKSSTSFRVKKERRDAETAIVLD